MASRKRSGLGAHRRAYFCLCTAPAPPPPKTFAILYDGNTNTSGNAPVDSGSPFIDGSIVTVAGNDGALAKTGYTFSGWNTAANGSGTTFAEGDVFAIAADTILYAQWTLVRYTITYNGNTNTSGSPPTDSGSPYVVGATISVAGNTGSLAKTGYTFSGWNTAPNGSGTQYGQGNAFSINGDIVLYAQWTAVPVVPAPTSLSSVGGNQTAYILFTQSGSVENYEYSTDDGETYLPFSPPQTFSPVTITTLSADGTTRLTNGLTYPVKLKAVNSEGSSNDSSSVNVTPTTTTLKTSNRVVFLDANNTNSYGGSGTTWTNLESGGAYSAALTGSPAFNNTTTPGNHYFEFNKDALSGQYAQINAAAAINPLPNQPFTIQMWVRINNVGTQGSLLSKVYFGSSYDGYAVGYGADASVRLHENGLSQVYFFNSPSGVVGSEWALYTANIQFGNGGGRTNKLFVNGRQVVNSISNEGNIYSNDQNLTFPSGFYGEGECDIAEFYYYNTELTVTEIIQNFDATKSRYM